MRRKSFGLFWWWVWAFGLSHGGEVGFFGGIEDGDWEDVRREGFWGSFSWSGIGLVDRQISRVLMIVGLFVI
jgi:hypothetical protein